MRIANGLSEDEEKMFDGVIDRATCLSGYGGSVTISRGKRDPLGDGDEGAALTSWTILNLFSRPRITLFDPAFQDSDTLGVTLTHELIHCRQGFLKVTWQTLLWMMRSGFPPIEEEAYDAINLWWKDSI